MADGESANANTQTTAQCRDARVLENVAAAGCAHAAWSGRSLADAREAVRVGAFGEQAIAIDDVPLESSANRQFCAGTMALSRRAWSGGARVLNVRGRPVH